MNIDKACLMHGDETLGLLELESVPAPCGWPGHHLAARPMAMATALVACLAASAAFAEPALQDFSFDLPLSVPVPRRRLSGGCPVTTGYMLLKSSALPPVCSTPAPAVVASDSNSNGVGTANTTSASTMTTTRPIVGCRSPHALYDLGNNCQALAAGSTCSAPVGSSAHLCIERGTVEFSCPAGNIVNSEPYLVSTGMMRCRACHISMHVADVDRRAGYFQGTIEWGPNMIDGIVNETLIDRYFVLIVDSCNVVLSVVGMKPKRGDVPAACCLVDAYQLTFATQLPDNYDRFTVMAVKDGSPSFIVQGGVSSARIVDSYTAVSLARRRAELLVFNVIAFFMLNSHFSLR